MRGRPHHIHRSKVPFLADIHCNTARRRSLSGPARSLCCRSIPLLQDFLQNHNALCAHSADHHSRFRQISTVFPKNYRSYPQWLDKKHLLCISVIFRITAHNRSRRTAWSAGRSTVLHSVNILLKQQFPPWKLLPASFLSHLHWNCRWPVSAPEKVTAPLSDKPGKDCPLHNLPECRNCAGIPLAVLRQRQ